MNEYTFQFAVLRYVHDPLTQEFLNIGVILYSKEALFLKATVSQRYGRLSKAFGNVNGDHYRRIANYIERRIERIQRTINSQDNQFPTLRERFPEFSGVLSTVLPPDDSSLVFGGHGGGITDDCEAELSRLFERLVSRYSEREAPESRDDDAVWAVYRKELEKVEVMSCLQPVTIHTSTYEYPFSHAWKNERWHPLVPVSLDVSSEGWLRNKADQWIGRMINLSGSSELGSLTILLGKPSQDSLSRSYENAVQNLRQRVHLELRVEIVEEEQAAHFSTNLARIINAHQPNDH